MRHKIFLSLLGSLILSLSAHSGKAELKIMLSSTEADSSLNSNKPTAWLFNVSDSYFEDEEQKFIGILSKGVGGEDDFRQLNLLNTDKSVSEEYQQLFAEIIGDVGIDHFDRIEHGSLPLHNKNVYFVRIYNIRLVDAEKIAQSLSNGEVIGLRHKPFSEINLNGYGRSGE